MSFLTPGFLFAFALALPLIGVYLLKVRPKRVPVTALFLWERVFIEKKSSALFHKLRDALSLLLMLAALSMLALGAARPRLDRGDDRDVLLLIDHSASMSARSAGSASLDRAKAEALAVIGALSGGRRAAVASVADRIEFQSLLTDDPRRLREAIASIEPSELPSSPAALAPIASTVALADNLRVLLMTDTVGDAFMIPAGVETVLTTPADDAPAPNVGFAAADLLVSPAGNTMTLLFRLTSSHEEPIEGEVVLRREGTPLKIMPVTIEPGINAPLLYSVSGEPGRYELAANLRGAPDALARDHTAYLVAHEPRPIRVAIATDQRFFFEQAITAFDRSGGLLRVHDSLSPGVADVAIALGPPADGQADLHIVFAPWLGGDLIEGMPGGELPASLPRLIAEDHPALRFLPVEDLTFAGARELSAPEGSAILAIDAAGTPLIWQHRRPGRTMIVFNFDPALDEFFLSPFFPLIVHGAATHLGGRTEAVASTYPTGDRFTPPGLRPGETARITAEMPITAENPADHPAAGPHSIETAEPYRLERAGYYTSAAPSATWDVSASLLHRFESQLAAAPAAADLERPEIARGLPLWMLLAMAAVIVLVAEEILYHRRKVG